MNFIQIAGHLGTDVETRVTPDGLKVSSIRVATNQLRAGRDETVWWRVTLWGDRWDKVLPYLKKGSSIIVMGELQKPEIYNNRDGQPQVSLDIRAEMVRFNPFGKGSTGEGHQGQQQQQGGYAPQGQQQQPQTSFGRAPAEAAVSYQDPHHSANIQDDDLPF